jgi:hypothetical protein
VPYRLPHLLTAIIEARVVYICEGEKDCLYLVQLGLIATTNAGGANKWQDEITPHFAGADVVVVADNDEPGRDHANDVAGKLTGTAKRIRVLDLVKWWPECAVKGDISDWLEAGHGASETGKLDILTADNLINDNRIVLNALVDEQKLLAAQGGQPETTIRTVPSAEAARVPAPYLIFLAALLAGVSMTRVKTTAHSTESKRAPKTKQT